MKINSPKTNNVLTILFAMVLLLVCLQSATAQNTFPSSGNAGAGGTSPLTPLEVYGPVISTFTGNTRGALSIGITGNPTDLYYRAIDFNYSDTYAPAARIAMKYDAGLGSYLYFGTSNSTATGVTNSALVIDPNGKLGIGTASPTERLHVAGGSLSVIRNEMSSWLANNSTGGETDWAQNAYYSSGWKYRLADEASRIQLLDGKTIFSSAAAGSADAALAWTDNLSILQNGNVGIGTTSPAKKLAVVGDIDATGAITGGTINAKYQDVAEWVETSQSLRAGTVVVLDHTKSNQVIASSHAYDTRVAGVVSAHPGITLGEKSESKVLVATTGRVKVYVDATRGPIEVGDLLVTSDIPGVAMKSQPVSLSGIQLHRPGTLIGKALESLASGRGEILVLISLQ